jgi:thiosulfate/3-mercaptopyruvate sulfurtransferase
LISKDKVLLDGRTKGEYSSKKLAPSEYSIEYGQIGGHIPKSVNTPWSLMVNEDFTLKSAEKLKKLYESVDVSPDKEVITYCGIGERAAYIWFILKYLLGIPK